MVGLLELGLEVHRLTDLPSVITQLTALETLDLAQHEWQAVPNVLSYTTHLCSLTMFGCRRDVCITMLLTFLTSCADSSSVVIHCKDGIWDSKSKSCHDQTVTHLQDANDTARHT